MTDFLNYGKENAVTADKLAELTGLSKRAVYATIQRLRLAGCPVCASSVGYWLSDNRDEIGRTARRQYRRAMESLQVCSALKRHLATVEGQTTLF